ncbi:GNAT family N-acetyltransferase [Candidatus Fermentibacteria bacterium]|nr:GNAT family N-acetyltransferase [Candidatus Fermentibacteria bacterium]
MRPRMRRFGKEDDFRNIKNFLREVFLANQRVEFSWQAARLDYWRWHVVKNLHLSDPVENVTFIWETEDGDVVSVLNPESRGEAFLQVHPDTRTKELEEEMLVMAEENLSMEDPEGGRELTVWAHERDELRCGLLEGFGYHQGENAEYQRRRLVDAPIPKVQVPSGYTVRAMMGDDDIPPRSLASWRAFHEDEPGEEYEGWKWYNNIQATPLYRRDLDIVAVTEDGKHAAFCTVWYDDMTNSAYFEPVGTDPKHRHKGLAKAVMYEALSRLRALGALTAHVAGTTEAANELYASVGFDRYLVSRPWTVKL